MASGKWFSITPKKFIIQYPLRSYMKGYIAIILCVLLLAVVGCTFDPMPYAEPIKHVCNDGSVVYSPDTCASVKNSISRESAKEPIKKNFYFIGESAIGSCLKLTVKSVRFAEKIIPTYGFTAIAPEGKEYAIPELTLENICSETQSTSLALQTKVVDEEGHTYSWDLLSYAALESNKFGDGEIMPTMKSTGELPFLVPKNVTDLKFIYQFDILSKDVVAFDIK